MTTDDASMETMRRTDVRTHWPALVLSLLCQVPVVVAALLATYKGIDVWLLVAAGPLELVRLLVLISLSRAYHVKGSSSQALRCFSRQTGTLLATFALIFLLNWILISGLRETAAALSRTWIWVVVLIPIAVLVAENALTLFFFNGDVRAQAARLDAMANDAVSWFVLVFLVIPAVFLGLFLVIALLDDSLGDIKVPAWIEAVLSAIAHLYPAAYFAGKAIVLAQVHTARFALTGRCVFA